MKPGVSPASLSVLASGTCSRSSESPPHQSALLLCFQLMPGSLALAMAMPSPAPSLQPWGGCGFRGCDSLGYLTIPSSVLDFCHCMKFAALNCPSGGCFSEWALSSTDVLSWRCSYETLNGGVQQGVTYIGGKPQRVRLGGDRFLWYLKPGEWVRSSQRQHRGRRAERGQRQSLRKRPADQGEREQLPQCWPAEKPKKEDTVSIETL